MVGLDGDVPVGLHEAGYMASLELLQLPDPPTALFVGNDLQALGIHEAARELGLRIPEDLSVVGFDDLSLTRWIGRRLTTVRRPLIQMAETAARLVLDLGRGGRPATTRVVLATKPVVRIGFRHVRDTVEDDGSTTRVLTRSAGAGIAGADQPQ